MVKLRSTAKKIRDKRRLLAFLIRERCQDKDVRLDYWQLCVQLRNMVNISEGDVDLKKHPEQRLICLIGTVQKSLFSLDWEQDFVRELLDTEIWWSRIAMGELTSNPTVNGNGNEFTHRFQINVILDSNA